jgi:hypothetical protein
VQPLQSLAASLALFGVVAVLLAIVRSGDRRKASAIGHALLAGVLLAGSVWLWPIGAGLEGYERLHDGQPVAELHFEQLEPARFRVTMTRLPDGRMQVFELPGHGWRVDARTLSWRGAAARAGFPPRYQLDRLTGLDLASAAEVTPLATYELGDAESLRLWQRFRAASYWRRLVEARQVYGPNQPMADGARYEVTLSARGLDARPTNETAAVSQAAR